MADDDIRSSAEQGLGNDLAEELRRLHPLLTRQRAASAVRPEASFKRALRAQLTATPETTTRQGAAAGWRTLIAMLLPPAPQLSPRGQGSNVMTYTAEDLTISLAARPAGVAGGDLISLYGEVDFPNPDEESAAVEVLHGEAVVATAAMDDLGNFVVPGLVPRVYALRLRFSDRREVIIPPTSYDAEGGTTA